MRDKNESYTPEKYINLVRKVLGEINLDPFSCEFANKNYVKADRYITKENDAHSKIWYLKPNMTVFMNPPYSGGTYKPAVDKFLRELNVWKFEAITLTNNNTETIATQNLMQNASAICLKKGRINYLDAEGKSIGNENRFAQIFCYFGNRVHEFRSVFQSEGQVFINPNFIINNL
jgi:hypothetical protein